MPWTKLEGESTNHTTLGWVQVPPKGSTSQEGEVPHKLPENKLEEEELTSHATSTNTQVYPPTCTPLPLEEAGRPVGWLQSSQAPPRTQNARTSVPAGSQATGEGRLLIT